MGLSALVPNLHRIPQVGDGYWRPLLRLLVLRLLILRLRGVLLVLLRLVLLWLSLLRLGREAADLSHPALIPAGITHMIPATSARYVSKRPDVA